MPARWRSRPPDSRGSRGARRNRRYLERSPSDNERRQCAAPGPMTYPGSVVTRVIHGAGLGRARTPTPNDAANPRLLRSNGVSGAGERVGAGAVRGDGDLGRLVLDRARRAVRPVSAWATLARGCPRGRGARGLVCAGDGSARTDRAVVVVGGGPDDRRDPCRPRGTRSTIGVLAMHAFSLRVRCRGRARSWRHRREWAEGCVPKVALSRARRSRRASLESGVTSEATDECLGVLVDGGRRRG